MNFAPKIHSQQWLWKSSDVSKTHPEIKKVQSRVESPQQLVGVWLVIKGKVGDPLYKLPQLG